MSSKKRVMNHGYNQYQKNYCSINISTNNINSSKVETAPLLSNPVKLVNCCTIKTCIIIFALLIFVVCMKLVYNSNHHHIIQNNAGLLEIQVITNVTKVAKCTDNIRDCHNHGKCINGTNLCQCDYGYTTHKAVNNTMCNYKQKRQLKAFLLTLFLGGFGAGRFYVGWYATGIFKITEILIACVISCYIGIWTIKERDYGTSVWSSALPLICSVLGLSTWIILDIIFFGMNMIPDENGVKLASMI